MAVSSDNSVLGSHSGTETVPSEREFDLLLRKVAAAPAISVQDDPIVAHKVVGEHFEVQRVLGAGGMGTVYLARDRRLGRDVALKLHRGGADLKALHRLEREARAMARLSHPNVLVVHEVGTWQGQLYIAMEFVDGSTLRQWLARAPRSWTEIVDVFIEAGAGLVAAHDAGLVHLDFKPENVLLRKDGRVLVADFGLARSWFDTDEPSISLRTQSVDQRDLAMTLTDGVAGTPAYMAPERFGARAVGPAADQFSFCVALHQAVYGGLPYGSVPAYAATAQDLVRPPRGKAPRWLRTILARGVALQPEERFADMRALLDALRRCRTQGRRYGRAVAGAGIVLGAGLAGAFVQQSSEPAPCEGLGDAMETSWRTAKGELRQSAIASQWSELEPAYDAYARQWVEGLTGVCEQARVERSLPEPLFERSTQCFEGRRRVFEGTLAGLQESLGLRATAQLTADNLPSLSSCSDPEALRVAVAPPDDPEVEQQVADIRGRLARARTLSRVGQGSEAQPLWRSAINEAEATGYLPIIAQARYEYGIVAPPSESGALLEAAYLDARKVDDRELTAAIALDLAQQALDRTRDPDLAWHWTMQAEAEASRSGAPAGAIVNVYAMQASVREVQQRFDEAIALYERAIAAAHERAPGREPIAQIQLASCYGAAGRDHEALEHFDRWWDEFTAIVGKDSTDAAAYASNRALSAMSLGRYPEAIEILEHANRVLDAASGFEASLVAGGGLNLGISYVSANRIDEGVALLERVRAAVLEQLGPDSYDAGLVEAALGWAEGRRERAEPALRHLTRAREIQSRHLGPQHPEVAVILEGIADAERQLGREDEALRHFEEAIAIWDASAPTMAERSLPSVASAAELYLSRRDDRSALDLAGRVLRRSDVAEGQEESFGRLWFVAARVKWRMGQRDEARGWAQRAIDVFRRNERAARAEQVQRWLAEVER